MTAAPSYRHHDDANPGVRHLSSPAKSYSTAFAIIEALWEAGVKNIFVNVGSDHPSIIEAIIKGKRERGEDWPRMITCPAEVTAISMADGYARISGEPQAVIVHVDVGTQALGQGLHNASVGRVPVFILAGLCPYTESGEKTGSRTEYMHWLQEAPDQKAIVRQYCRYTGEIRTGLNAKQTVARALQFASSGPKGPVYVACAREVLAEEIIPYHLDQNLWKPMEHGALPFSAVQEVIRALTEAQRPLVITGYSGRNERNMLYLERLADLIPGLRVHDTGGSDCTRDADTILILDCDIPWIPSRNPPPKNCRIFHIDIDPLNQQIPISFFPAHGRWRCDSFAALTQMVGYLDQNKWILDLIFSDEAAKRRKVLISAHEARLKEIATRLTLEESASLDGNNIGYLLKKTLPSSTTYVIEAVTCAQLLSDQLRPDQEGKWINCGATGIGWSNGAALGVKMALDDENGLTPHKRKAHLEKRLQQDLPQPTPDLVVQVVGDGSFMCAAPSSALWAASKFRIPILTIVLNNGGWKAPRNSTALVYPEGLNKNATDDELNISFKPSPNYVELAVAASGGSMTTKNSPEGDSQWLQGVRVETIGELEKELSKVASRIQKEGKGMFIEAIIP